MSRAARHTAVAFSLIEILISVLVLGIGLLGLGAVFPVVIREQRISTERVEGVIVANNAVAEARLLTDDLVSEWWEELAPSARIPDGTAVNWDFSRRSPSEYSNEALEWQLPEIDVGTGEMEIISDPTREIVVSDRIYPKGLGRPQYVWDLAVRIVPYNSVNGQDGAVISKRDQMRVVIFVRRVDPGIRPAALAGVRDNAEPHPVAVDDEGQPTRNGLGDYAVLRTADIRIDVMQERKWIEFPRISDEDWDLVRQPNQRLVDGLGTVYTVIREVDDAPGNGRYLEVDPPLPASVTSGDVEGLLEQVVFSPQVPAAVTTYLVAPDFDVRN